MEVKKAMELKGSLVIAVDPWWGSYIGVLDRVDRTSRYNLNYRAYVRVLACTEYPKQHSKLQNTPYQRKPFPYVEIQSFDVDTMEEYKGNMIAEQMCGQYYEKSVLTALDKAIASTPKGEDLYYLKLHRKNYEGKAVAV